MTQRSDRPADCRALEASLLEAVFDVGRPGAPLGLPEGMREHAEACPDCRELWRRASGQVEALRSLPRLEVPSELEGRVVAAMQAGHRQERVAHALTSLQRRSAPRELDAAAIAATTPPGRPMRRVAPDVLDRLVDESLRDLPATVNAGLLDRLPRLHAPAELDARVDSMLVRGDHLVRRPWMRFAGPIGVAAAALLVAAVVALNPGTSAPDDAAYPFEVVRHEAFDPAHHSATTLDLLESMTGQPILRSM